MELIATICFLFIVVLFICIFKIQYSKKHRHVGYKIHGNRTMCKLVPRNTPVNKSYCPYRAILGTWTDGKNILDIKLDNPYRFLINGEPSGNISCSIGPQLTIRTEGKVFILDGDKLMYSGSIYQILPKK